MFIFSYSIRTHLVMKFSVSGTHSNTSHRLKWLYSNTSHTNVGQLVDIFIHYIPKQLLMINTFLHKNFTVGTQQH